MTSQKKLLVLTEWFTPGFKAGGPIQSLVNLCRGLQKDFDIWVVTTDTDHGETRAYEEVASNNWIRNEELGVWVYYISKQSNRFKSIRDQISAVNPDSIYLNLFFSPAFVLLPLFLKYRGQIKAHVVLCPRGTLYDSALSFKWYKKKPFLRLLRLLGIDKQIRFHATNEREAAAVRAFFPGARLTIADNWPASVQAPFRSLRKITGELNMIFIARIFPIKNLLFVLNLLPKIQDRLNFTVVGPIEDEPYWQECQERISRLPENITVYYLGPKKPDELPALLQAHHLFILPTTGENFGHSIFEALVAGRPVLISDQTPWMNLEEHKAGWSMPLDNPAAFVQRINGLIKADQATYDIHYRASWDYAATYLNNTRLSENYKELFN